MDWFKNSFQAAQKQAQEAAEKARVLAQQASQQALVLAGQASEQAKVFAEQASEKAKQASERAKVLAAVAAEEAQAKFQQLATVSAQVTSSTGGADADPAELVNYGVTPGLLETISGMTYSTFSDYPVEELPSTNPLGLKSPIPGPSFRLNSWQERHALLVLSRGDQLQGLRFALCPKRMSEELFWVIYFTLVKTLLPPEAFKQSDEGAAGDIAGSGTAGVGSSADLRAPASAVSATAATPSASTTSSTKRLLSTATPGGATATTTLASPSVSRGAAESPASGPSGPSAATPTSTTGGGGGRSSTGGDEGVLVDVGTSSNAGDDADDDHDDDDDPDGDGEDGDLAALEDDPELAAYLEEALDVAEGGEGDGLSDLGSATDDLDDYINQLDAELAAGGGSGEGDGEGEGESSPGKQLNDDK